MDSEFGPQLLSKPFKFIVGTERKEFYVHADTFSRLSKPLNTLINGKMHEAIKGTVVWDDMDAGTFGRFAEFAYTNEYTTPTHPQTSNTSKLNANSDKIEPAHAASWKERPSMCCDSPDRTELQNYGVKMFRSYSTVTGKCSYLPDLFSPSCLFEHGIYERPSEYPQLFHCHAQLYVAGDKYDITRLQSVALGNLHRTLLCWEDWYEEISEFVSLLRYTLDNTLRQDPIRRMLVLFAAVHFKDYQHLQDFKELMDEYGEFSADLAHEISQQCDDFVKNYLGTNDDTPKDDAPRKVKVRARRRRLGLE